MTVFSRLPISSSFLITVLPARGNLRRLDEVRLPLSWGQRPAKSACSEKRFSWADSSWFGLSSPRRKNIPVYENRKSCILLPSCRRQRGATRSSRVLAAGCDGRAGRARRARQVRTAKSCGPVPPTLGTSFARWWFTQAMVAKEPGTPGRARSSR